MLKQFLKSQCLDNNGYFSVISSDPPSVGGVVLVCYANTLFTVYIFFYPIDWVFQDIKPFSCGFGPTVDIKSLHIPVQMPGFSDIK